MYKLLNQYENISDIKKYTNEEMDEFSKEIRAFLIENVSATGGHLAPNLGVVELTLSLFRTFDFDKDKIVWDVGHQSYIHKILTGRKEDFKTLRSFGGLSGFPKRCESKYDMFETGHSSTSISAGAGMARARDINKDSYNVISVIGDGALTGGMSFEALNDIGFRKTKMIVVLNDNAMSISKNVGSISSYLSKVRVSQEYNDFKKRVTKSLSKVPLLGKGVHLALDTVKNGLKYALIPSMFFEDMGLKYFGPIDGHDINDMCKALEVAKNVDGPVLFHVVTKKGKGYEYAEKHPAKFHGIGPFDAKNGEVATSSSSISYSKAFGEAIVDVASTRNDVVAVTAAMPDGTGLNSFADKFPNRFFDVGIAEQHAVTMAAGMASGGMKPVFAVYSTFLQRAYDQVLHDVCIQNLPVIFAIDRAGIVGNDGETHQGVFDISFLSHMPNMNIIAPKKVDEVNQMLSWALTLNKPIAIRYPRGGDSSICSNMPTLRSFELGKWEKIKSGEKIAIIASGKTVSFAYEACEILRKKNINATLINAWSIKPIDECMINELVESYDYIVTVEDNVISGGLGSLVLTHINDKIGMKECKVMNLGFPDEFICHGDVDILYNLYKIDAQGIYNNILNFLGE